jgi:transcriptional regulator with XRE-family HTH domain
MDEIDVGKRLRQIRNSYGLSQRQLAERSGVTNGTISMIEKNSSSPSVASLKKVLAGIPMTLSEFFSADETDAEEKYFFTPKEMMELSPRVRSFIGPQGSVEHASFKQVGDASQHQLQILYETYPPGTDTGKSMLSHDGEEGGFVISGEVEVSVGDKVQVLRPGDSYLFDSRLPHRFRNISDAPCILVSACTPPTF